MRYRMELLDQEGVPVYIQTGEVELSGNWYFNIDAIRREIAPLQIDRLVIKWGDDAI